MTLEDARALAQTAHRGQEDKLGVEYIQHVEAVAAGLLDFRPRHPDRWHAP
jgi:(p)ppGpp synthase/HD superfamily hydrolase